mmetsp:Transcript_23938/g.66458  ORF Transcript_23938/g.66458 Transcript_23938/m.66458 type:complete len:242 (-) Transcript_23938:94-819(-)
MAWSIIACTCGVWRVSVIAWETSWEFGAELLLAPSGQPSVLLLPGLLKLHLTVLTTSLTWTTVAEMPRQVSNMSVMLSTACKTICTLLRLYCTSARTSVAPALLLLDTLKTVLKATTSGSGRVKFADSPLRRLRFFGSSRPDITGVETLYLSSPTPGKPKPKLAGRSPKGEKAAASTTSEAPATGGTAAAAPSSSSTCGRTATMTLLVLVRQRMVPIFLKCRAAGRWLSRDQVAPYSLSRV